MTDIGLEWMDRASCAAAAARYGEQTVESWFFPCHGGSAAEARRICAACPVRAECANHAITGSGGWQEHGVWGGLLPDERRDPRRTNRTATICGTNAGYTRHVKRGETPCDHCRKAKAEYMVQFRRKKAAQCLA